MSLTVKYIDVPDGAQQAAQVAGDPGQPFSNHAELANGTDDTSWATLENRGWPLDGTRRLMPNQPQNMGWWSDTVSDADGNFKTPPVLTVSFPAPYTATGLTFVFWPSADQWCSKMKVSWYNGQVLLMERVVQPTSARWTLKQKVESFDTIKIELFATNLPGQFAKLQQIIIGQTVVFGADALTGVQLINEVDPSCFELPVDTMTVSIHDRTGYGFAPQENQRMELYRDGQLLAAHFITESSREGRDDYTFSCQSAIGLLEDSFLGGFYNEVPLEHLVGDILSGWDYQVDTYFADQTVTGYLPICTRREALQQVAFAIGALVTTQGGDTIRLIPLPGGISASFGADSIFSGAKVETAARIARYEVTAHHYTPSSEEETLLDDEYFEGEDLFVSFDAPHCDYRITGGILTGVGPNWVTITAEGNVTLTAKPYIHRTTLYTRSNSTATAAERGNVLAVNEATLVHKGNAKAVLERMYAVGELRQTLKEDVVVNGHTAGQRVSSENPWGSLIHGFITSMESTLGQSSHTATVTILGLEAPALGVHYYSGELYAGDREVVY